MFYELGMMQKSLASAVKWTNVHEPKALQSKSNIYIYKKLLQPSCKSDHNVERVAHMQNVIREDEDVPRTICSMW
jgi:hypothetical protein